MIESVPLIQNANDAQQINASIIAMKKASKELDEKILKLNNLNKELDKKIAVLDSGLAQEITNRNTAITNAVNSLDVASVGGSGKYISAISETDGKISATVSDLTSVIESGNNQPATSGGVADAIQGVISLPTDAVLHYSFDDIPDYPDGTADVRLIDNNTYQIQSTDYKFRNNSGATFNNNNGKIEIVTVSTNATSGAYISNDYTNGKLVKIKFRVLSITNNGTIGLYNGLNLQVLNINAVGNYEVSFINTNNSTSGTKSIYLFTSAGSTSDVVIEAIYIGDGSYSTPVIDNANGQWNSVSQSGVAVSGVSGKGLNFPSSNQYVELSYKAPTSNDNFTISLWLNISNDYVADTDTTKGIVAVGSYTNLIGICRVNNEILFISRTTNGSITRYVSMKKGQWHLYTMVYKGSTHTFDCYVDGVKQSISGTNPSNYQFGGDTKWILWGNDTRQGSPASTTNQPATLDDLLIFDRALSETEVQALYLNKANTPKYYNINNYNLKWKVIDINFTASVTSTTYTQILSNIPDFNEAIITFSNDTLVLKRDLDSNYTYATSYAHYTENGAYDTSYDVRINWDTHILNFRQLIKGSSASWITVRKLYYR
jgi:hypothetical protein